MYFGLYQHMRVVLYLLYTQPEISFNYCIISKRRVNEVCDMDRYITWPFQIADHNCKITWVYNKTGYFITLLKIKFVVT